MSLKRKSSRMFPLPDDTVGVDDHVSWTGNHVYAELPTSTATPSLTTHLTTKTYVDTTSGTSLLVSNNAWTGTNSYTQLPTSSVVPTSGSQFTNKTYVDTVAASTILASNNAWTGTNSYTQLPTSSVVPTSGSQFTNKTYVDTNFGGLASANTWTALNTFNAYLVGSLAANQDNHYIRRIDGDGRFVSTASSTVQSVSGSGGFILDSAVTATRIIHNGPVIPTSSVLTGLSFYFNQNGVNDTSYLSCGGGALDGGHYFYTSRTNLFTTLRAFINSTSFTSNVAGIFTSTLAVTGITTFTAVPVCSTNPTTSTQLANKAYVDSVTATLLSSNNAWTGTNSYTQLPTSSAVPTSGDQFTNKTYVDTFGNLATTNTWTLVNTFSVPPISATTPTTSNQLVNKTYVDSNFGRLTSTQTWTGANTYSGTVVFNGDLTVNANTTYIGGTTCTGYYLVNNQTKPFLTSYVAKSLYLLVHRASVNEVDYIASGDSGVEGAHYFYTSMTSGTVNQLRMTIAAALVNIKVPASCDSTLAVTGIATFTAVPVCSTNPTTSTQLANKAYVDTFGNLTTTNTWTLVNTFSVPPISATTPTTSNQLVNKTYVDSNFGGLATVNTWTASNTFSGGVNILKNDVLIADGATFPTVNSAGAAPNNKGMRHYWNVNATGDSVFLNEAEAGTGGFSFYSRTTTTVPARLMEITPTGDVRATKGFMPTAGYTSTSAHIGFVSVGSGTGTTAIPAAGNFTLLRTTSLVPGVWRVEGLVHIETLVVPVGCHFAAVVSASSTASSTPTSLINPVVCISDSSTQGGFYASAVFTVSSTANVYLHGSFISGAITSGNYNGAASKLVIHRIG